MTDSKTLQYSSPSPEDHSWIHHPLRETWLSLYLQNQLKTQTKCSKQKFHVIYAVGEWVPEKTTASPLCTWQKARGLPGIFPCDIHPGHKQIWGGSQLKPSSSSGLYRGWWVVHQKCHFVSHKWCFQGTSQKTQVHTYG